MPGIMAMSGLFAAARGHKEVVEFLIENGADVKHAFMRAVVGEYGEAIELLLPKMGGSEGVRKWMKEEIRKEKDPVKRLNLKIEFSRMYRMVVSCLKKENPLGELKTAKLQKKEKGKFRVQCRTAVRK